jgi:hypothetical protein
MKRLEHEADHLKKSLKSLLLFRGALQKLEYDHAVYQHSGRMPEHPPALPAAAVGSTAGAAVRTSSPFGSREAALKLHERPLSPMLESVGGGTASIQYTNLPHRKVHEKVLQEYDYAKRALLNKARNVQNDCLERVIVNPDQQMLQLSRRCRLIRKGLMSEQVLDKDGSLLAMLRKAHKLQKSLQVAVDDIIKLSSKLIDLMET